LQHILYLPIVEFVWGYVLHYQVEPSVAILFYGTSWSRKALKQLNQSGIAELTLKDRHKN